MWYYDVGEALQKLVPRINPGRGVKAAEAPRGPGDPKRTYGEARFDEIVVLLARSHARKGGQASHNRPLKPSRVASRGSGSPHRSLLVGARKVAANFSRKTVENFARRGLTYSHILILASVDATEREHFAGKCMEGKWSVRQLKMETQGLIERPSPHGRPPSVPSTYRLRIAKFARECRKWIDACDTLVLRQADATQRERTDARPARLELTEQLEKVQAKIQECRTSLGSREKSKRRAH
jgi:hypothetical protein